MSDYKVFNDIGEERTWEELYEDNVMLVKYTDKLEKRIDKALDYIDYALPCIHDDELLEDLRKILKGGNSEKENES